MLYSLHIALIVNVFTFYCVEISKGHAPHMIDLFYFDDLLYILFCIGKDQG